MRRQATQMSVFHHALVYAKYMAHHAYLFAGEREEGIKQALAYGERELGLPATGNPDVIVLRYGLFSVTDARRVITLAEQGSVTGDKKLIVLSAGRLFHEAQNALLKLFEEPVAGTTLVLVVPTLGIVLPTLRSRTLLLLDGSESVVSEATQNFIRATPDEREKIITKLLDRTKADKDEDRQTARGEALLLAEGLLVATHESWKKKPTEETRAFMNDLERFLPIFHERSAPLKLIFEHLLITAPKL